MTQPHRDDPVIQALRALPCVEPDVTRADRLRARCRARLEQPPETLNVVLEPASVGTVCAMYAWEIVRTVIR